jgi:hypothetical protein
LLLLLLSAARTASVGVRPRRGWWCLGFEGCGEARRVVSVSVVVGGVARSAARGFAFA